MSAANVELVRSIFSDWELGDYRSADWADPDIEYVFADGPSPGNWKGLAEMAESWREWLSAWEEFHAKADDYQVLDDERVLVLNSFGGRGTTSGMGIGHLTTKGASVFHIRDGKVTRLVLYWDRGRALGDLGLASAPNSPDV
jgi:ketosteroid isomerase-like protein